MKPKHKITNQSSLFFNFDDTLNQKHPLFILGNKIHWHLFEDAFLPLYTPNIGRPAKPVRLMVGLLMLKHIRNISDESVVEQWSENIYYQYFCGETSFIVTPPCQASELVHFRHRIGEQGIELILKESIRINGDDSNDDNVNIALRYRKKTSPFLRMLNFTKTSLISVKKFPSKSNYL